MKKEYRLILNVILPFLLAPIMTSCSLYHTSDFAETPSNSAMNIIPDFSKDNMLQTIEELSAFPRPINSEQIKSAELYLETAFKNLGYTDIELQTFEYNDKNNENAIRRSSQLDIYLAPTADKTNAEGVGTNIIVTKASAADTKRTLLLSAHYDSTEDSCGANDNGSGVAVVLELARVIKNVDLPYNVRFIMFSGEEKFMLGSRWYVNTLSEEERNNIIGLINIDSVAEKSDLGYMIMLYGNKETENLNGVSEDFNKLAELNKNNISDLFIGNDRFALSMAINSDHYPFALVSVPAISIVQDWHDGLNANSDKDTFQDIDPDRLEEVAAATLQAICNIS